ncbi:MAG TPA: methyltransferase domain-containing protein [Candidatus Saccharimonadales bacterium]|nr:methyltransferase domain-containing protein [Candidatus Saccharimonadales bacterium]
MIWWIVILGLLACFAGVLLFGAPYLPTLKPQVRSAMALADLQTGETLLELGCGDGRVLLAAAQKGAKAVGYELNPVMALVAWLRTRKYRKNVRVIWGDFWRADWPEAAVIFTFLLPKYMKKLDKKIVQYPHKPVKLVSFAFKVPGRRIASEQQGVFRYDYR